MAITEFYTSNDITDPSTRNIGDSGLSVGTHLALESIFVKDFVKYDTEREIPNEIDISKYNHIFFNMLTLLRNIIGSFLYKDKDVVLAKNNVISILIEEIEILRNLFDSKLYIYYPNYDKVLTAYNTTDKKLEITSKDNNHNLYNTMLKNSINKTLKGYADIIEHKFPKVSGETLVFTSYPIDLLNKGRISLLESNTGKLKTEKDFYTKLHSLGKEELDHLPFIPEIVYIFGDNNLIKPLPLPIRRLVYDISKKKHWTYKTTTERIKMNLKSDTKLLGILDKMKNVY